MHSYPTTHVTFPFRTYDIAVSLAFLVDSFYTHPPTHPPPSCRRKGVDPAGRAFSVPQRSAAGLRPKGGPRLRALGRRRRGFGVGGELRGRHAAAGGRSRRDGRGGGLGGRLGGVGGGGGSAAWRG